MISFTAAMFSYLAFLLCLPFTTALHIPVIERRSPATTTAASAPTYCPVATYPNGQTTTVCYDTSYYRSADQGQKTNSQADVQAFMSQCQQSCSADSQCTAYVLAEQLAADSNLATAVCFFYSHTPAPRACSDSSNRRLYASVKATSGSCVSPTTTTSTTTTSTTTTTRSTTTTTTTTTRPTTTTTSTTTTSTTTTTRPTTTTTSTTTSTTTTTRPTTTTTSTTTTSTTTSSTTTTTPTTTTTTTTTTTPSTTTTSTTTTSTTTTSTTTTSTTTTTTSTTTTTPVTTTTTSTTTTTTTSTTTTTTSSPTPVCTSGSSCTDGLNFYVECGNTANGNNGATAEHVETGIANYQQCQQDCANESACNAYSFNAQTGECDLYDNVSSTNTNSDPYSIFGYYYASC